MVRCVRRCAQSMVLFLCTLGAIAPSLQAQQPSADDLRKEIRTLTEAVKAMQKDLQEIKALLAGRNAAAPAQKAPLDLTGRPVRGNPTARLVLVEFSDYECPYCARHALETAPEIEKEYIKTGKLKQVFFDFPLESIHKLAFKAAESARCAGEQGKYWEMHDRLFADYKKLALWNERAQTLGLDIAKFEECLNSGRMAALVRKDMAEAQKAGISSTPTFFLGYSDESDAKVMTEVRLSGAQPLAMFKSAIDKMLASPPKTTSGKPDRARKP